MENTRFKPSIYLVLIIILVLILIFAIADLGPFAEDDDFPVSIDAVDSNLIVMWGGDTNRVLETKALVDDLEENGVPGGGTIKDILSISFHRMDGRVFVADLGGQEIKPCAALIDGRFVDIAFENGKPVPTGKRGTCSEKLVDTDIIGLTRSVTLITEKSPECPVDIYGGYAMERCPW